MSRLSVVGFPTLGSAPSDPRAFGGTLLAGVHGESNPVSLPQVGRELHRRLCLMQNHQLLPNLSGKTCGKHLNLIYGCKSYWIGKVLHVERCYLACV